MTVGHLPGALGPLTTAARAVWFVAWSALAGATAWSWLFGPSRPLPPAQTAATGALWRKGLELGWPWVAQATLLLFVAALFAATVTSESSGAMAGAGASWLALAIVIVLLRAPLRRMASPTRGATFERDRVTVTWLVGLLAAGEVATARTRTKVPELVRIAVDATHLASAGVWLGTLAMFVVLLRSEEWRLAAPPGASVRPVVRPVVEASARAAAVLVISGIVAAGISSPGLGHWTSEYSWLLGAKAAVLVVAAAIAWRQWVLVHSAGPMRRTVGAVTLEAGALVAALALAAVLVGVDPLPSGASAPAATPSAASAPATTPTIPACMHGAPGSKCDRATITSVVAATAPGALDATIPQLCTADPAKPRTLAYSSCLAEVGQVVADHEVGDLTTSLTHCQAFADAWSQQQCGSGAIYEALQSAAPPSSAAGADPIWPCSSVPTAFAVTCFLRVSTRMLAVEHGDITASFRVCDGVIGAWQASCYQGMGRELATETGFAAAPVVGLCAEAGALGPGPCIAGAVRALVYFGSPGAAASLCTDVAPPDQAACETVRAAATALL